VAGFIFSHPLLLLFGLYTHGESHATRSHEEITFALVETSSRVLHLLAHTREKRCIPYVRRCSREGGLVVIVPIGRTIHRRFHSRIDSVTSREAVRCQAGL